MSKEEVAQFAGVTPRTISRWENDEFLHRAGGSPSKNGKEKPFYLNGEVCACCLKLGRPVRLRQDLDENKN